MSLHILYLLIFLFQLVYSQSMNDPIVETDVGRIQGLRADDGDYNMFLGVPYARINENNAFGESSPYPNFDSTFLAHDDSVVCPQIEEFNNTIVGALDCLTLNIFVPTSASSSNTLPVFAYIYGGGFAFGFGNRYLYGPSYLVRHDIIMVTINYRVGPYGFTCLDSPSAPGNQGLKDQVLALRWIQKHIGAFGGDANKVTVSGNSAGSMSVDFHLISNYENLFDKAILQSGTVLGSLIGKPVRRDEGSIKMLSAHLGRATEDIDEALNFLSGQSSYEIIEATNKLGLVFGPCIESQFNNVENFITVDWLTANSSKVENMNIVIGVNDDEMYSAFRSDNDDDYQDLRIIEGVFQNIFYVNHDDFNGMTDITQRFYFGDQAMSAALKRSLVDFLADFYFIHPTYRSINKYLNHGADNIFLYVFSHVGLRNFVRHKDGISNESGGAVHADELGYLFDISYMKSFPMTPEDQAVIDHITTLWANFVKFGNPTPSPTDIQWDPITQDSKKRPYLDIGVELVRGGRPFNTHAAYWDLFYKANGHLQIVHPATPPPSSTTPPPSSTTPPPSSTTPPPSSSVTIKINQLLIFCILLFYLVTCN